MKCFRNNCFFIFSLNEINNGEFKIECSILHFYHHTKEAINWTELHVLILIRLNLLVFVMALTTQCSLFFS